MVFTRNEELRAKRYGFNFINRYVFLIKCLSYFFFLFFVGCTHQPTKVYQTQQLDIEGLVAGAKKPLTITDQATVIDVRSLFEYSLAHIPQSLSMQWTDFTVPGQPQSGLLNNDLFKEARRMAVKGLDPQTPIIVVGDGPRGAGEEGRMAWTLLYMGFKNVQFAALNHFKNLPMTQKESPPKTSSPMWKPHLVDSLLVDVGQVKKVVSHPQELGEQVFIIDVRTEKEYFQRQKGLNYKYPDINAIHIPWTEFIDEQGRPNLAMKESLKELGVFVSSRIIVISQRGVRSGAVTAALTLMGYTRAANFAGGYQQLFSDRSYF